MLYVSVRWSRLQGLNLSKSVGVIGRIEVILDEHVFVLCFSRYTENAIRLVAWRETHGPSKTSTSVQTPSALKSSHKLSYHPVGDMGIIHKESQCSQYISAAVRQLSRVPGDEVR